MKKQLFMNYLYNIINVSVSLIHFAPFPVCQTNKKHSNISENKSHMRPNVIEFGIHLERGLLKDSQINLQMSNCTAS